MNGLALRLPVPFQPGMKNGLLQIPKDAVDKGPIRPQESKQPRGLRSFSCLGSTGNGVFRMQNKLLHPLAREASSWTRPKPSALME